MKLTTDQRRALKVMNSGANVFLSGVSGTGKSFLINVFTKENRNKNVVVCAPEGNGADKIGGAILDSVFGIPRGVIKVGGYNPDPEMSLKNADIVIIDDISMCRIDIFEYVIRTLKYIKKCKETAGDFDHLEKQIILSGDFYRLAPVIRREDKHDFLANWGFKRGEDRFAFNSSLWDELSMTNVILGDMKTQDSGAENQVNPEEASSEVELPRAFVVVSTFYNDIGDRNLSGTHHIRKVSPQDYSGWDDDEDALLQDEWSRGIGIDEISRKHGRTVGAIRARLMMV